LAIVLLLFPGLSLAQTTSLQELMQIVAKLQAQLAALQAQNSIATTKTEAVEEWKFNYSKANIKLGIEEEDVEYGDDDIINLFWVQNNRLYEDKKWTKDRNTDDYKIWNIFAGIAGDDFVDKYIVRYATYRFEDTGVLGFVQPNNDGDIWGLAINAKAVNFDSAKWKRDLVSVLLHEYVHIFTLNEKQVNHKKTNKDFCTVTYFGNQGCSEKKSYINAFAQKFWTEKDLAYSGSYTKYYEKHPDDFITKYAAKSAEEDIAESFTQFILYEKPTGTKKKDLKVAFFYDYPEFIEMRTRIRGEIKQYFVK
jgi:hypothetical protein